MARVYRAYHPQLDRYVAVKVLRSDLVEEEEFLARFKREARAVAGLRHPNIVQVFDFDVQDNLYYMVMELMEGDTLATRLHEYRAQGQRMPWGEMVRIQLDVLDGLAYAHSEGMIHRDVKPANVLLTKEGQAVLTDFGIAQIVGGTRYTVSGALMGTLAYMAPEQGLEGQCDVRSDLYSLGIVFYEMLTGEPPFDAETPLAILLKHVNDPLPLPRKSDPSIPKQFERVVLKALAKKPKDRYQSAGEMAEALHAAAKRAKIELPTKIDLPASFTTAEELEGSVAVISGTARDEVLDAGFAADDTDAHLGQRLAAEVAAIESAELPEPVRTPPPPPVPPAKPAASTTSRPQWHAILNAVALLIGFNLLAVMAGLVTGGWGTFGRGWPVEILLVGLILVAVMETTESIWLLIPTGIVLGNGYLFSFYALTEAWRWWAFLWPLEPLLIGGVILYTIRLAGEPDRAREVACRLARALRRPAILTAIAVALLGLIFGS
jgi:serine/threonine protein kinase